METSQSNLHLLHRSAHITLHCSHSDLSSYLSNKCVPRLLSIARNDARDMKMSCFKVKPRSQVTKSTVKQFGTKNITSGSHMFL